MDESDLDAEPADAASEEDKEIGSEEDKTMDETISDTEGADTAYKEENDSEEDDTLDGTNSFTGAADTSSEDNNPVHGTISDSWEEIIAAGEDGTCIDKYKIGDTKELDLGEEGVILMELVAFEADELADGSGKAHITWIAKNLLNTEHAMSDEGTNGGWPDSDMRIWLRETVFSLFPEMVRSNIKEVKKYSYSISDNGTLSSIDTIWIPSCKEICGGLFSHEFGGPEYKTAFSDAVSWQKQHIGDSEPSDWWLRTSSCYALFDGIQADGSGEFFSYPSDERGVAIGF